MMATMFVFDFCISGMKLLGLFVFHSMDWSQKAQHTAARENMPLNKTTWETHFTAHTQQKETSENTSRHRKNCTWLVDWPPSDSRLFCWMLSQTSKCKAGNNTQFDSANHIWFEDVLILPWALTLHTCLTLWAVHTAKSTVWRGWRATDDCITVIRAGQCWTDYTSTQFKGNFISWAKTVSVFIINIFCRHNFVQ